jgi:hypothetical protein
MRTAVGHDNSTVLNTPTTTTSAPLSIGMTVDVTVFNSLARGREEYIELPLAVSTGVAVAVVDGEGTDVPVVVIPALPAWLPTINKSFAMASDSASVVFKVTLAPLTAATYRVAVTTKAEGSSTAAGWTCGVPGTDFTDTTINGDKISLHFSGTTGLIYSMNLTGSGSTMTWPLSQEFAQYHSTTTGNPNSNAYQFAPNRSVFPFGEPLDSKSNKSVMRACSFKSPMLERVIQTYAVTPAETDGPDCRTFAPHSSTAGTSCAPPFPLTNVPPGVFSIGTWLHGQFST